MLLAMAGTGAMIAHQVAGKAVRDGFFLQRFEPADLPKSWEEVATPKYKGMIALDDPMRAGPLSSSSCWRWPRPTG